MNKTCLKYIGKVLIGFSILLLFPIIIALIYKESIISYLIPSLISLIIGLCLNRIKPTQKNIYAKDGFIIVNGVMFDNIPIADFAPTPLTDIKSSNILNSSFVLKPNMLISSSLTL